MRQQKTSHNSIATFVGPKCHERVLSLLARGRSFRRPAQGAETVRKTEGWMKE
jgi:hypothetical protein